TLSTFTSASAGVWVSAAGSSGIIPISGEARRHSGCRLAAQSVATDLAADQAGGTGNQAAAARSLHDSAFFCPMLHEPAYPLVVLHTWGSNAPSGLRDAGWIVRSGLVPSGNSQL